jgi:predicted nucleotidyltransferase
MHPAEAFQRYRKDILQIADSFGARNPRVFGSIARGDATEWSDVDILVQFDRGRSLLDLVGLKQALEDLLGCRVHVVSEPALKRSRRKRILAEARPI